MKRYIIAAGALLLFVGASLAAEPWQPVRLDRVFSSALARLDPAGSIGQLRLAGSSPVTTAGRRRGHYRPPEHGRSRGRRHSPTPAWHGRRPHYHGSFWRWVFGGCWCRRNAHPRGGHSGRREGGRGHGNGRGRR